MHINSIQKLSQNKHSLGNDIKIFLRVNESTWHPRTSNYPLNRLVTTYIITQLTHMAAEGNQ